MHSPDRPQALPPRVASVFRERRHPFLRERHHSERSDQGNSDEAFERAVVKQKVHKKILLIDAQSVLGAKERKHPSDFDEALIHLEEQCPLKFAFRVFGVESQKIKPTALTIEV